MVPRRAMVAIKNRGRSCWFLVPVALAALLGCTPPGPRALLEGQRLLDAGKYPEALERLTLATTLLPSNAPAWNYLGLACHRSGEAARAAQAYQRALMLNRDLFEAHYNLGCLWLEQGKPELAKPEFIACTMSHGDEPDAWLKLGSAQYRLGEASLAEESFQKVLKLSPNHPEALNGLGLTRLQKRRPREAVQFFSAALKATPNYAPAILNLATVLRRDLADPVGAARNYRAYLELEPRPADWEAVNTLLRSLEQKPAALNVVSNAPPPVAAVPTNSARATAAKATIPSSAPSNQPPPFASFLPLNTPSTLSVARVVTNGGVPPPVARTVVAGSNSPATPVASAPVRATNSALSATAKQEKPSLLSRLNPFHSNSPPPPAVVEVASAARPVESPAEPSLMGMARYHYRSPTISGVGDRKTADQHLTDGLRLEDSGKLPEAKHAYLQATLADPAYFEAQYRMGLAHYAARDYAAALSSWENALAIRSDSAEARYNFALTLKAAGYPTDAAAELERILAAHPEDIRAHLVLANLCAEQLRDKPRARVHYQRILELDSRHPQAAAIRYWLVANPG